MFEQLGLLEHGRAAPWQQAHGHLTVRESRRAKRLILQCVPPHTLELVVPKGTRPKLVEAFVREHKEWIDRARRELADGLTAGGQRHDRIELRAIGRDWQIEYAPPARRRAHCAERGGRLMLHCADPARRDAAGLLRRWLLAQARRYLKPWLAAEAARCGLVPRKVQVRVQRTRWGSCSARGVVSLNASLLFVDAELVRYLFVHELSHLRVLNHSPRFWRCVERFVPDYKLLDKRLEAAWTQIPCWVFDRSAPSD
jgi:hypothetical protein